MLSRQLMCHAGHGSLLPGNSCPLSPGRYTVLPAGMPWYSLPLWCFCQYSQRHTLSGWNWSLKTGSSPPPLSKRPYIRIAGDDFPREVVRSRFLKINSSHVEYVFGCIDNNTTKVGNIKAYLLTALYNAPATMDSYYRAEVNHDLYGSWDLIPAKI